LKIYLFQNAYSEQQTVMFTKQNYYCNTLKMSCRHWENIQMTKHEKRKLVSIWAYITQ